MSSITTITDTVFVIPDVNVVRYDMSNIYFKEHSYRKMNTVVSNETDCTSTHITYIDNTIIMNGLTFLINLNSPDERNDYAFRIESALLKLYADTYRVGNKRMLYSIYDDVLKIMRHCDACKKIGLYIIGVWENTLEYGLDYKWLEFTHQL